MIVATALITSECKKLEHWVEHNYTEAEKKNKRLQCLQLMLIM